MRTTRYPYALAFVLCLGCSGQKPYNTAAVSGTVLLDGQPLSGARVTFQPERAANAGMLGGPESHGETDTDGNYTLMTVFGDRGATVGKNRVTVSTAKIERPANDPDGRAKRIAPEKVPQKYRTAKGWLYFDVPSEGTRSANFDLTSK